MVNVMGEAREGCRHEGMSPHIEQCGSNSMCKEHKGMSASGGVKRHRQQCGFKRLPVIQRRQDDAAV
jgi:hypothetical protein